MTNKKIWERRTKLEKCLLTSFLTVGLILFGLIIFLAITFNGSTPCGTPSCIFAAYEIINNIDPSIDPCEDFFAFACGNAIKTNEEGKITKMKTKMKNKLDKLMKEPINSNDHYLVKNQKNLFQVCMNETTLEEESFDTFQKLIADLNGWPALVGSKWDENLFDWKVLTYKLRQNGLAYASWIDLEVHPDVLNTSRYMLHLKEPFIDIIEEEQRSVYINFMINSLIVLGTDKNLAKKDVEDMFEFRQKLSNVSNENDWDEEDTNEGYQQRRQTVKNFQNHTNFTNWIEFINKMLQPIQQISEDDYVMFTSKTFINELINLLDSTPKRVQANYIFWSLYESLIDFFPKQYRALNQKYNCEVESSTSLKSRVDFCKRIVRLSFDVVPTEMLYAEQTLSSEFKHSVQQIIKNIKEEFISILRKTEWMDETSLNQAIEKTNSIVEVIGTYNHYQNDPIIKRFEFDKTISKENDSLLTLYFANRKVLIDMSYTRINTFTYSNIFNKLANNVNAVYSAETNTIALHLGLLQDDLFHPLQSNFRNYGMLGAIIGHEITHGFCKDGSIYDADGRNNSIWTNKTTDGYENAIKCLLNETEKFEIDGTNLKINGTRTLEENIADVVGVEASYNAYRKWVLRNGEEAPLVGLDYTPYQLFWISTVSYECYKVDKKDMERLLKRDNHALNVFRVINPLKNNKNFAMDFKCQVGSKMNPAKKCQVFGE